MVQLYLNNQECDLYGSETIATDYSIAPIANIASRTSAKSVTFKIPLTANNRAIIENANVLVNETILPYRFIPAKLTVNGLTQRIEFAQLKSIKDDIEVTLFGSNVDFYSIIKGRKVSDLGGVYVHLWNLANAFASRNNTSDYVYALIDYHSDSPNFFIDNTDTKIDVRGLLSSVYLHSVIDLIIRDAGFTPQGDFLNNANYKSVLLASVAPMLGNGRLQMFSIAEMTTPLSNTGNVILPIDEVLFDPLGLIFPYGIGYGYNAYLDGNYTVRLTITYTVDTGSGVSFEASKTLPPFYNVTESLETKDFPGAGTFTRVIEFENLSLEIDQRLQIGIESGGNWTVDYARLEVIATSTVYTIFGKLIDPIVSSVGDMKAADLLKDTVQKFGLILQVDNINKIVHIRQFSEILANLDIALDWSEKVDYTEKPEISFDSDYAQRNLCTYEEDETVDKPAGTDSEILIDNDHLQPEKELFESPFAASEQVLRFGGTSIVQIKTFTDLGGADEEIADLEPRYLVIREGSFSPAFTWTDGTDTETDFIVPLTHFILGGQAFNVGWENNLLDNSADLIAMIQRYKSASFLLRLNAADINQLDFFIPVWIELNGQPGCYFYISEVKQFKCTNNESTDVTLVKLTT